MQRHRTPSANKFEGEWSARHEAKARRQGALVAGWLKIVSGENRETVGCLPDGAAWVWAYRPQAARAPRSASSAGETAPGAFAPW